MGDIAEFVTRANAYNDEYILAMRNLGIDLGDAAVQVTETYLAANDVRDEAQAASLARLDAARAYREHAIKGATGRKDDAAKPDWSLLPLKATEEVVKVLTFGAKKYSRSESLTVYALFQLFSHHKCQKLESACSVRSIKHLYPASYARDAIINEISPRLSAPNVTASELFAARVSALPAMRLICSLPLLTAPWPQKSISKSTAETRHSELKSASESDKEGLPPVIQPPQVGESFCDDSLPTAYQKIFTSVNDLADAVSVVAPTAHTLTTTIAQGITVAYYVASATTLLDCLTMTFSFLNALFDTSAKVSGDRLVFTGRDNWQIVPDGEHRYLAAALRHLAAHQAGERSDSESGESHLAHAACCILFLIHKQLEAEKP